ncbi:hypothetical protein [Flexistipes sinusarabici]|uniref:hypothetical protein n=1 Tax=Flexistipes sinusarabici TaxID=2352 RepID=UPI0023530FA7|nr:hypothetical protein [Flexistipes sinusarabici]
MRKFLSIIIILMFFAFLPMIAPAETTFGEPFSNGSPACVSCHSIAAAGYTTPTWAIDLSTVYNDLGGDPEVMKMVIKSSGVKAMDAVYGNAAIPATELDAKVSSFAAISSEKQAKLSSFGIYTAAGGVLVVFLIIVRLFFRRNNKLEENR